MQKQGSGSPAKVVVSADHHLGQAAPSSLTAQRSARVDYLRSAFADVCAYSIENSARLLLIAGDIFDNPAPAPDEISFVHRNLVALKDSGTVVAAISGDSDAPPKGSASVVSLLVETGALAGLEGPDQERPLTVAVDGFEIAVFSLPIGIAARDGGGPLSDVSFSGDVPHQVLMGHFSVEDMADERAGGRTLTRDAIKALTGIELLVCGHNHAPAHDKIGETTVVAPGSPLGKGGFISLEMTADGIQQIEVIQARGAPRVEIHARGSDLETDDPLSILKLMVESRITRDSEATLRIHGEADNESLHRAGLAKLSRWAAGRCASFEVDLTDLRILPDDSDPISESTSPTDEIRRIAAETAGSDDTDGDGADEAVELVLGALRKDSPMER